MQRRVIIREIILQKMTDTFMVRAYVKQEAKKMIPKENAKSI